MNRNMDKQIARKTYVGIKGMEENKCLHSIRNVFVFDYIFLGKRTVYIIESAQIHLLPCENIQSHSYLSTFVAVNMLQISTLSDK